ncbi:ABC transporter permease [Bradyrhizobium sp. AS23.2]|nr:ABC transporter permease [Bradyrhizobium sp. AS23.2]
MLRVAAVSLTATLMCHSAPVRAEISNSVVKIGILTDMAGPYSDQTGLGSVIAAQMAIDDFGGTVDGKPIVLISADHQNKPDVGSNIARQWLDIEGVDLIADLGSSGVALAVQNLVRDHKRLAIYSGPGTDRLTNDSCSPYGIHWTYDTYASGRAIATAMMDEKLDTWFFVTMDNAFGKSLEETVSKVVIERGGKVLGSAKHPSGTSDFSSYILQAQSSGAKVIVFANSGADFVQSIKQAREFGMTGNSPRLTGPAIAITDIKALGKQSAAGLQYVEAFYAGLNDKSAAFSKRFKERKGSIPGQAHAGVYSAVTAYLQAVEAVRSDNSEKVIAQMRSKPVNDAFTPSGTIRIDGRMVHDMYLMEAAEASATPKEDWDIVRLVKIIPGDQAFRPLDRSECPLVKVKGD